MLTRASLIISSLASRIIPSVSTAAAFSSKTNKDIGTMVKARTTLDEFGADGSLKRSDSVWRNWVDNTDPNAKFQPEKDRYHLYVAYACPWAHRCLVVRALKGLEDVISVTAVMPEWQKTKPDDPNDTHCGWVFADPKGEPRTNSIGLGGPFPSSYPENDPDPIYSAKSARDIYQQVGDTEGKYTVPILFDKKLKTIVSNESSEIIQMLNSEFNDLASNPDLDLAPTDLESAMKEVDEWIYPNINNGVYRCGFAKTQTAYDKAITDLTDAFDKLEETLSQRRYIAGDRFTLSDIRLVVTLLRFDEVYVVYFKTNTRLVATSPALLNYCREIYQMAGIPKTCNMAQIKEHYFCSHPELNKFSIIPRGSDFERLLKQPHGRDSIEAFKRRRVNHEVTSDSSE